MESISLKHEDSLAQKSKRRRTSPQDSAILEAAYQANSKPGKEERASIVSQVQLGEKEVQIWFQNRRQNDRRRSKPLQPHELVAHITNISPSSPTSAEALPEGNGLTDPDSETLGTGDNSQSTQASSPESEFTKVQSAQESTSSQDILSTPPMGTKAAETAAITNLPAASVSGPVEHSTPKSKNTKSATPPSSGRKRSHSDMVSYPKIMTRKEPLKRSSSIRLAMTVDGAVKIKTTDELTPSPEKDRVLTSTPVEQGEVRRLSRTTSMVEEQAGQTKAQKLGGGYGRSRDHRKWEFYCDNGADSALSIQAEAERSGSAVGAINLIRSSSLKGRGLAMGPAPSRANMQVNDSNKTVKPKLSRAKSSFARLASQPDSDLKKGSGKARGHRRFPSDSDKENWAPGTQMSENPLRRTQPTNNQRPILQANEVFIFPDASKGVAKATATKLSPGKEKAVGEDLDCIQGLLSLSQGAWR